MRRNKADIVPYFNLIVPLVRQNFNNFGTQKPIEIVEPTTTLLNPEQAITDTSDQPLFALSKRL